MLATDELTWVQGGSRSLRASSAGALRRSSNRGQATGAASFATLRACVYL